MPTCVTLWPAFHSQGDSRPLSAKRWSLALGETTHVTDVGLRLRQESARFRVIVSVRAFDPSRLRVRPARRGAVELEARGQRLARDVVAVVADRIEQVGVAPTASARSGPRPGGRRSCGRSAPRARPRARCLRGAGRRPGRASARRRSSPAARAGAPPAAASRATGHRPRVTPACRRARSRPTRRGRAWPPQPQDRASRSPSHRWHLRAEPGPERAVVRLHLVLAELLGLADVGDLLDVELVEHQLLEAGDRRTLALVGDDHGLAQRLAHLDLRLAARGPDRARPSASRPPCRSRAPCRSGFVGLRDSRRGGPSPRCRRGSSRSHRRRRA